MLVLLKNMTCNDAGKLVSDCTMSKTDNANPPHPANYSVTAEIIKIKHVACQNTQEVNFKL